MKSETSEGGWPGALSEDMNWQYLAVFLGVCLSLAVGIVGNTLGGTLVGQILPGAGADPAFVATTLGVMIVLLIVLGLAALGKRSNQAVGRITYEQRLSELTASLVRISREVDAILLEEIQVIRDRVADASQVAGTSQVTDTHLMDDTLAEVSGVEETLRGRVEALKEAPLSVAEQYTAMTEIAEKRSARRSYVLFAWGMVLGFFLQVIPGLIS